MTDSITIKVATINDLDEIIKLQTANQTSQGGTLSGGLTAHQIQEMITDMPQIIAVINNEIVGFLLTTSQNVNNNRKVPIVDAMSASYKGSPHSYIYGPICVSQNQRGKGLAQLMFQELLKLEPNREGILFIKSDNLPSLKAHEKMGIHKVSNFHFNNADFDVYAYLSPSKKDTI
ncbi:GNAT family N-acetyltransferase [Flavobacterium piscisymbiosum]|uniref:GNAT family N-acetyltransferase n=1 Tax=Flavobacterium piscisymbiosum TaxID=2893753 RepID=A0ABS8MDF2_9FLAO|nr:GNAT family N-acetyltransferase [Flavobacterium sp. F-30]MCC9063520.1 GNAT family N-acetyltransferase [Flavobacterium sp. F-30]